MGSTEHASALLPTIKTCTMCKTQDGWSRCIHGIAVRVKAMNLPYSLFLPADLQALLSKQHARRFKLSMPGIKPHIRLLIHPMAAY